MKNITIVLAVIVMYITIIWAARNGPSLSVNQQEHPTTTTTLDSLLKLHHAADSAKETMPLAPFLLPGWPDSL